MLPPRVVDYNIANVKKHREKENHAKIILTSRYLRDAPPAQLENYVRYVSTREGVEKVEGSRENLPSTAQQKELIRQIVRDIPSAKEMLEYTDFLLHPTMGNASEFISCAMEQDLDLIGKRENYVDYIANRPRVERVGDHGLFTDAGKAVVLKQVQEEAANHKGVVWTHVISCGVRMPQGWAMTAPHSGWRCCGESGPCSVST